MSAAVLVIGVNEIRAGAASRTRFVFLFVWLFASCVSFVSFFSPSRWTLRFVLVD